MTQTYKISGMTCGGCVSSVNKALTAHSDIEEVNISLESGTAEINMKKHLSVAALQKTIGTDKYQISKEKSQTAAELEEKKSWLNTYKPLLLIFFFLAGTNLLIELKDGVFSWMGWMNGFMAGFFLLFSFFKFLDLKGFANTYRMYDLLAAKIPVYGFVYPFIELALGIAFLTSFNPSITYTATIIIMGFSSLGVIRSVIDKQKIRCACLGSVFNLPMSTVTIVEDLLMVAMAGVMLYFI